ncbi:hypothetical protein [Dactylosporangium sp. NPDC051541]|uniref:hypothetical protein n=1 Tax=Dactylosporangium sp. NPDC051541 TaxID=3363977 RepID=UPI00379FDA01
MAATLVVLADPVWAAPPPADTDPTAQINAIIGNITRWVTGMLFGVATLFLTISGARRLTAGGDPTQIERAGREFKNALIGYALALLAPVALGIVRSWLGA